MYDPPMVDTDPGCDQCGSRLNRRYPLRLVSNDPQVATKVRRICTACIGGSIATLEVAGRSCPGCAGVHEIFLRLAEGIRDAGSRDQAVLAIVVPPNKAPHVEGCEYGPGDVVRSTTHKTSQN